jgi:hypothetical protein
MKMKKGLILTIRPLKDYKYNEADSKALNKIIAGKAGRREALILQFSIAYRLTGLPAEFVF